MKNPFRAAIIATLLMVFAFSIILLLNMDDSQARNNWFSGLASIFTCVAVVWMATGIYLSQMHLEEYSKELRDHRHELGEHTKAFNAVSASLEIGSFMQVFKIADQELLKIEKRLLTELLLMPEAAQDRCSLHEIGNIHDIMVEALKKRSNLDKRALAESYCRIFQLCEKNIQNHPAQDILKAVFFSRSNTAKNHTLIATVLFEIQSV